MEIQIDWLAVFWATLASMVLAKVWFNDRVFGKGWRELTGITPDDSKKVGKKPITLTLFANIVTVIAMAALIYITSVFFNSTSVWYALLDGFVAWLAFSATTLLTHNAFEQKPSKLTMINNGYQLALFMITALILGLFGA